MISRAIKRINALPHSKNVIINTLGTYIGFVFSGLYIIFFVRALTPVEFGTLSILQAFSYLLTNLLSFGMPASVYAHLPSHRHNRQELAQYILSNLLVMTLFSSLSLIAIYTFMIDIDTTYLKTFSPNIHFILMLVGTQLYIWQNYLSDTLNASGHFLHINISNNVSHVVRMAVLIALALTDSLSVGSILFVMGFIGPSVVFIRTAIRWRSFMGEIMRNSLSRRTVRLSYTFTYYVATQLYQIASRADLFIVSYFLTRPEVGFYGLSQKILLAIATSSDSITQVLSAQFAKVQTRQEATSLLRSMSTYMLLPMGLFAGALLMPQQVYTLIFSAEYDTSTFLTKTLAGAYIFTPLISGSLLFFLYTIRKPTYLLISNSILCATVLILNTSLVPRMRLYAPAITYAVAFSLVAVFLSLSLRRELRKLPSSA